MTDLIKKTDVFEALHTALSVPPFVLDEANTWVFASAMLKDIPTATTGEICACGNELILDDFKYCPYCGRKIKE